MHAVALGTPDACRTLITCWARSHQTVRFAHCCFPKDTGSHEAHPGGDPTSILICEHVMKPLVHLTMDPDRTMACLHMRYGLVHLLRASTCCPAWQAGAYAYMFTAWLAARIFLIVPRTYLLRGTDFGIVYSILK